MKNVALSIAVPGPVVYLLGLVKRKRMGEFGAAGCLELGVLYCRQLAGRLREPARGWEWRP